MYANIYMLSNKNSDFFILIKNIYALLIYNLYL